MGREVYSAEAKAAVAAVEGAVEGDSTPGAWDDEGGDETEEDGGGAIGDGSGGGVGGGGGVGQEMPTGVWL